jgi:YjbE family integral membrane protein
LGLAPASARPLTWNAQQPESETLRVEVEFIGQILRIIAIDLVLSGDNAVVIAMASRRLPAEQRKKAIIWGGGGAVALRIVFTIMASLLLDVDYIQAIGGLLLIYIAVKLVRPGGAEHGDIQAADTMRGAIQTIIMADVVMSLDNMLAVGAAGHGHIGLLIFGLMLSIPILLFGSSLIARLIDRYPWLNYVGAAILVHTALELFFADDIVHDTLHVTRAVEWIVIVIAVVAVTLIGIYWSRRAHAQLVEETVATHDRRFNAPRHGD